MIHATPQAPRRIDPHRVAGRSIRTKHRFARVASLMLLLWPAFAAAESGLRPQLRTLVFAAQPIESWSRLYHCVLTTAEFRKALKNRTLENAVSFAPIAGEATGSETGSAIAQLPPNTPMAPLAPPPGIPILAQMLPKIADITMVAPAGHDSADSANSGAPSASETSARLPAQDGPGNRAAGSRPPGEVTSPMLSESSASGGPIASYPVSKAKLADIKAREAKLGLPVPARGTSASAVGRDGPSRGAKHPDLDLFQVTTFDSLLPETFVGKSSKNGFVDKQTGY